MQPGARRETPGPPINYQKVFIERVLINFTAPEEPGDTASGQELLHGYLCDVYRLRDRGTQFAQVIDSMCQKWNVIYVTPK